MPAGLEGGMGDCVQTEGLNSVDILKKGNVLPTRTEQVYTVSENILPQILSINN